MPRLVIMWWVTCLIWGSVWMVIKIGLADLPPISFAGWRLVVALVVLSPYLIAKRAFAGLTRRDLILIAWTGLLLLGVNYAFVFWGAQFIPSGLTAVLQAVTPAFGVFVAWAIASEPLDLRQLGATILGIIGLAIIFRDQVHVAGREALLGAAAVAAGAACVAIAYIAVKVHARDIPPIVLTSGQMIAGCIPLLVFGAIREGNPMRFDWTPSAVFALLYLAIAGSIAGFWLNHWVLKRMSATSMLSMSIVEPLIAVALGALFLQEKLTWRVALGGACILVSTWVLLFRRASSTV